MSRKSDNIPEYGKIPPQAIELEKSVLGAIMSDTKCLKEASKYLFDELFYVDAHQRINRAIRNLLEKNGEVDTLTVVEQLKINGELDAAGGPFYVAQLAGKVERWEHITYHTLILFQKYLQRRLISTSTQVIKDAYEDTTDVIELCEWAVKNFSDILSTVQKRKRKNIRQAVDETVDDIRGRINGERITMFETGWKEFDQIVSLDKPRLIVVPSNRKIGKTAFMLALAKQVIERNKDTAWIWFTLEMSQSECIRRFVSIYTKLDDDQIQSKKYKLNATEKTSIKTATALIRNYPIQFEEECSGIEDLKVKVSSFCDEHKDKHCFVVIDNHGYVVDKPDNEENICKQYKDLRDSTGACMFVLHHLTTKGNREFVLANGYEPSQDMIRGNTRLLDYCNVLLLLHRPNFYKDLMYQLKLELPENLYKLIDKLFLVNCVLNRHGDTGYIRLEHEIKYSIFKNLTK